MKFAVRLLASIVLFPSCTPISQQALSMAWRSSGDSNQALVDNLHRNGIIESDAVVAAMLQVDRANYAPSSAYADSPQPLGSGQTISAPHMHGACLELLSKFIKPGSRVLDVGSGSGYLTSALAYMVGKEGKAFGIEYIESLAKSSIKNAQRDGKGDWLSSGRLSFQHGDGSLGLPNEAPVDAIHVGAAAATLPRALLDQLAAPGRLVIPVGPQSGDQHLLVITKKEDGTVEQRTEMAVRYVPLIQNSNTQA